MIKNFILTKSRRLRSTPFSSRIEQQGVKGYTVYNHMLLPTFFTTLEVPEPELGPDVAYATDPKNANAGSNADKPMLFSVNQIIQICLQAW